MDAGWNAGWCERVDSGMVWIKALGMGCIVNRHFGIIDDDVLAGQADYALN